MSTILSNKFFSCVAAENVDVNDNLNINTFSIFLVIDNQCPQIYLRVFQIPCTNLFKLSFSCLLRVVEYLSDCI